MSGDWLHAAAAALQGSQLSAWASGPVYPVANVLHLAGLVMLVGMIGIVDVRLIGGLRQLPVAPLSRALTPVALAGLALMLPTGLTLFAADATSLAASTVFRWKLGLMMLALANAVLFRWLWRDRLGDWDASAPRVARAMAASSLGLWLAVGTAGRLIAYS